MFNKKTIRDVELDGRTVLLRAGFDVPLNDNGEITDDYRIRKSLPTIIALRERGCKIIICSHQGRPEGQVVPKLSLKVVADRLGELLGINVGFVPQVVGDQVLQAAKRLGPSDVMVIENLRFDPREKANDPTFAAALAAPAEYFVQDAFAVVHRSHASFVGVPQYLPSVAGLLVEEEVSKISHAMKQPKKPVAAIVGGAKIKTKIEVIEQFLKTANYLVIGGAMANTFLRAMGYKIGKSIHDAEEVDQAKEILELAKRAEIQPILPLEDVAVASETSKDAERRDVKTKHVAKDDYILDFGPKSTEHVIQTISHVGTVIWNGPLGVTELPKFRAGSEQVARFIAENHIDSFVGGGDTAEFIHQLGLGADFTHVSTGGGASLALMAGKPLPGVDALMDR